MRYINIVMDSEILRKIKHANSVEELLRLMRSIEFADLNSRSIEIIVRALAKHDKQANLRVAYLGNHTLDPLPDYVTVSAAAEGVILTNYIGQYNQYFQEILLEESDLTAFDPNLLILSLSMRELAPLIQYDFTSLSSKEIEAESARIFSHIIDWAETAQAQTSALLLIANFPRPVFPSYGIADSKQPISETEFYMDLNFRLLRQFKENNRVYMFDLDRLVTGYGQSRAVASKMYHLAKIPWQEGFYPILAQEILRYIMVAVGLNKKCLVVDLDNTLWGGVIGEDGPLGVKIGRGDAQSEAYLEFQYTIKALKERGIILAICSKNNHDDVLEVFAKRPEMPLQLTDFSVLKANWENKHENLLKIAETLNIGVDKLVFIDDNPAECAIVKSALPSVLTLDLPEDPAEYSTLLEQQVCFEQFRVTAEDKRKAQQYHENAGRMNLKHKIHDIHSYLRQLNTKMLVREALVEDIPRVHQLFSKTNQFNATTKRYTLNDIETFLDDESCTLVLAQVRDNFGDLGIIGLYLARTEGQIIDIDSFVMSCRALGRGIETALMNYLKIRHLINYDGRIAVANYIPTKKNKPAEAFFEKQGFHIVKHEIDGTKRYELAAQNAVTLSCEHIAVTQAQVRG